MLRSFRRATLQRAGLVLAAAVLHLFSVAPSAAELVYCIGSDGHSGLELLQGGGNGCIDCCHENTADSATLDSAATPGINGCRDILLSASDALSRSDRADPERLTAPAVGFPNTFVRLDVVRASSIRGFAPYGPLRASAPQLIRHTVLLI